MRAKPRGHGFTIIEIMAVVLIIGLMMTLVLPNLGSRRAAGLRDQARDVAGYLELARQRAIVTGKPHRLFLDLEAGGYRVEWYTSDEEDAWLQPTAGLDLSGASAIPMSPPNDATLDYRPIPSRFGGFERLGPRFFFEGVDTPEGWLERGDVVVVFYPDGTTDAAEIVISDDEARKVVLEIRPILDIVRIRDET